jgi:hypothetical protein
MTAVKAELDQEHQAQIGLIQGASKEGDTRKIPGSSRT